jgi:hypothetical protein
MVFRYASGDPTIAQTLQDTGDSFLGSASVLLRIVIALLPWALAAGLVAVIALAIRRRWFPKKVAEVETS